RLRGTKIIEQKFSLHQLNKVRSRPYRSRYPVSQILLRVYQGEGKFLAIVQFALLTLISNIVSAS
ncbi:hypothetical protein P3707_22635, partial [Vibrio parahaemolyticus]|nr:hypothetical protein [Vibrio parahaemolyticus]